MNTKRIVILVAFVLLVSGVLWFFFRPLNKNEVASKNKERIEEILKNLVQVDGGTFLMGSPDSLGNTYEVQHSVSVSTFQMQPTEVTQELYELVTETNPSENKAWNDMPVTNVSWEDCQVFIKKLNEITGKEYRLPTEAEWEYAAKGGAKSEGYLYAGSNNLHEVGWFEDNSGNAMHVVATKRFNEIGLYDMTGNVLEWCSDLFGPYRLDERGSNNPEGLDNGYDHVFRGGCWRGNEKNCLTTYREWAPKDKRHSLIGFRLVLPAVR
jgi:formylglycine-generating enzyme required for sulfatase activity